MPRRSTLAVDPRFGAEVRRLREAAGLSLRPLAASVFVSRAQLSKIELGTARPTVALARLLDAELRAGGQLTAMVTDTTAVLTPDTKDRLRYAAAHPRQADSRAIDGLDILLVGQRRLEDALGAAAVIDPVREQLGLVLMLVGDSRDDVRPRLVNTASQWAQFAGWLHAAVDDRAGARTWFDRALEWATEVDNRDMIATILSFKGYLAEGTGELGSMVGLSQAAQRDPSVYAGQRAYSAGQEARALAMVGGDPGAVLSKVSEAEELAHRQGEREAPPWIYFYTDDFFRLQRGIVYRCLGATRPQYNEPAVELLTEGVAGLSAESQSTDWGGTYLCDLAIAQGQSGDLASARDALTRARAIGTAMRSQRLLDRVDGAVHRFQLSMDRT
ncbi:multiprotein-bridging factor 1 family protein [Micromonospora sp. NPDC050397]|uniref:helix-turn-helix domain-containing protein n=1 Tax=Micromonospora sp. NPDC050397 TaxID=3364279 RepID=UPI00384E3D3A